MYQKFLIRENLQELLNVLQNEGYVIIGPQVEQGAIVYEEMTTVEQLPKGIQDKQSPGSFSLVESGSDRYFSWAAATHSIKPLCFSPREILWRSDHAPGRQLNFEEVVPEVKPTAVLGVRACDLAGLILQDRHFLFQEYTDPHYAQRRESLFLIAVNCSNPADTCFCASTGDGPCAKGSYDLVLTELDEGFIIADGSERGKNIIDLLFLPDVAAEQLQAQIQQEKDAVAKQSRHLPNTDFVSILKEQQEHDHWSDIGQRCLACGNCTAVCPSCFCHSKQDHSMLGATTVEHVRQWDSCFGHDHSYIHGIVIRAETRTRYRQWMTHKFSSWVEQYGRSGCTGCGRCITWCPVEIDVTRELAVLCGISDD